MYEETLHPTARNLRTREKPGSLLSPEINGDSVYSPSTTLFLFYIIPPENSLGPSEAKCFLKSLITKPIDQF